MDLTGFGVEFLNEHDHADHVTCLALRIFDGIKGAYRLPVRLRPLLAAASYLHDIGYASAGSNPHPATGSLIIRQRGVPGLTPAGLETVAAAVAMHGGDQVFVADPSPAAGRDAARIAAILRVADGLDHSHIQNTRISSIRFRNGDCLFHVVTSGFPENGIYSARKADLWQVVFRHALEIREKTMDRGRGPMAYSGIVAPGMPALEVARRIINVNSVVISSNAAGTVEGANPVHLHDMRVAMRRIRVCLRLFRKLLQNTRIDRIDRGLGRLGDMLGDPRDADVGISILSGIGKSHAGMKIVRAAMHALSESSIRDHKAVIRRTVEGGEFRRVLKSVKRLGRVDIPGIISERPGPDAAEFGVWKIRKTYGRLIDLMSDRLPDDPDMLHELRKKCRRARYLSEFFAPVTGGFTADLARMGKQLTDCLGAIHDIDVLLCRLAGAGIGHEPVRKLLANKRAEQLAKLRGLAKRLCGRKTRKMLRALRPA